MVATMIAPTTPVAADPEGVEIPSMIDPIHFLIYHLREIILMISASFRFGITGIAFGKPITIGA